MKQRLQAAGKNPADPAVVQELYEGMFQRIAKTHPLDYYWLWTPEGWTWSAVTAGADRRHEADFRAAIAAAAKGEAAVHAGHLRLGARPPQSPALFDKSLPKNMPMSCINRTVGNTPVEPAFANVEGRPKWAIPWMEDDPGLTMPQLWAGRMRRDAADSLAYGCTGLMGIHWRTRILGPNVSALAKAAWDQSGWNPAIEGHQASRCPKYPKEPKAARWPNSPRTVSPRPTITPSIRPCVWSDGLPPRRAQRPVQRDVETVRAAHAEKGKRVFGASVQGKTLFEHLDMFAEVGKDHAIDKTASDVRRERRPADDRFHSRGRVPVHRGNRD